MSLNCTRCEGSGFLNLHQIPEGSLNPDDHEAVQVWMAQRDDHDVSVCDCCGDGEEWYGIPGEHYNSSDPVGDNGPYASNGGLCQCH